MKSAAATNPGLGCPRAAVRRSLLCTGRSTGWKAAATLLKNLGRATAFDVELSGENTVRFDGPIDPRTIQMGEAVEFLAIGSMQTGTPELVVSWRDTRDGERREWRRPLP